MPDIIAISQALLTPVIAIATTYIAYQQYRIRRDERSLALYDRRLALYKLTIGIVDRIRAGHDLMMDDAFTWLNSIAEIQFLFGEEVHFVTNELFGAVLEYANLTEPVMLGGQDNRALETAEAALNVESFRLVLEDVFAAYLRPAGSPLRRKKRVSVKAAKKRMSDVGANGELNFKGDASHDLDMDEKDIPF